MKYRWKSIVLTALASAAVCISVSLPYRVQLYKDHQLMGIPHLQEIPITRQEELPALSVFDKLRLLSSRKVTAVSGGNYFSEEEIMEQCRLELQLLFACDILPQNFAETQWSTKAAAAALLLDTDSPDQGMILWTVTFSSDSACLQCGIDDETGKILYFYAADYSSGEPVLSDSQVQAFAAYLGASAAEPEQLSSFTLTAFMLPQEDSFQNDYQYEFILDKETLTYNAVKTKYGILFGHNLLSPVAD